MDRARLALLLLLVSCTADVDSGAGPAPGHIAQPIGPAGGFCELAEANRWHNQSIAQRMSGVTTIQFFARPFEPDGLPIDAVVGFSDQVADAFTDLGPIVRFNLDGRIDVRNGGAYTADVAMPYRSNRFSDDPPVDYFVRMVIDMTAHRYSVFVREGSGPEVRIAANYRFRTEQANLRRIGNVAVRLDSSQGVAFFCGGHVTPPVCTASSAATGWATATSYPEPSAHYVVEVDAIPQGSNIDAIVGLSSAAPSRYGDLAAIMRFNEAGLIDARDGDTYRAIHSIPYTANHLYTFVFIVDLERGTYSAWVDDPQGIFGRVVGDQFAFRTEQAGVRSLGTIGQKVDAGAATTCDVAVSPLAPL